MEIRKGRTEAVERKFENEALTRRIAGMEKLINFQGRPEVEYEEYQGRFSLSEILRASTFFGYFIRERESFALDDALVSKIRSLFERKEIDMVDIMAHAKRGLWYEPISKKTTEKIKNVLRMLIIALVK